MRTGAAAGRYFDYRPKSALRLESKPEREKPMAGITIVDCVATPTTITIFFSSDVIAVDPTQKTKQDMLYLANYTVRTRGKTVLLSAPGVLYMSPSYDPTLRAVTLTMTGSPPPNSNLPLVPGAPLSVTAKSVSYRDKTGKVESEHVPAFQTTVRGDVQKSAAATAAKTAEDAVSYPLLTEEVGYPPSPLAAPSSGAGGVAGGGAGVALGQAAVKAIGDVLGWKVKSDDPKGFIGALTQSFSLTEVEGHIEAKWTPRTYAVQSDLSGGLTGAQASIYNRAKEALDQALPLLDGLYALRPEAIPEDVEALKDIARSQMTALVQELGTPGAPRIVRINQYFLLLLGQDMNQIIAATTPPGGPPPAAPSAYLVTEPDSIPPASDTVWGKAGKAGSATPPAWFTPASTLGTLRDELGLWSVYPGTIQGVVEQVLINTIEDEQNVTNFRLLVDYLTSLAVSWINNQQFFPFALSAKPTPFFGTQLVLLSRQLLSVSEDVDDIRFAMDSVFLGPSERQTLQVNFGGGTVMFFEDFASWVQTFATTEGPQLIQSGGKFGVQNSFLPVIQNFQIMANAAVDPNPANVALPRGFHTARVQRALQQLSDDLQQLINLASQVKFALPVAD
jgi:hypothetical protein